MKLQEELKALKERIAELEQQVEQEKRFPQNVGEYWYVDDDAEVLGTVWYGDDCDQGRLSIGNIFQTKEQAEFAIEKLKIEAELLKFSRPFKEGGNNQFMVIDTENGSLDIWCRVYSKYQGTVYFESIDKAQQAIDTVGADRIKKYIFGVED